MSASVFVRFICFPVSLAENISSLDMRVEGVKSIVLYLYACDLHNMSEKKMPFYVFCQYLHQ